MYSISTTRLIDYELLFGLEGLRGLVFLRFGDVQGFGVSDKPYSRARATLWAGEHLDNEGRPPGGLQGLSV